MYSDSYNKYQQYGEQQHRQLSKRQHPSELRGGGVGETVQPTGLPEAYGGDRSIGQVRASATHLRHLLQRLVPDEQHHYEDPSQRSIRQDQDGGERVEPASDGRCLQDPHRAHGELHDPLLRARGEADGADLRRRPPQVQKNDPKHPGVRSQGAVVGLEV